MDKPVPCTLSDTKRDFECRKTRRFRWGTSVGALLEEVKIVCFYREFETVMPTGVITL